MTFLTTGTCGKIFTVWNVRAMPRRQILYAGSGVMSRPLNVILPGFGLSAAEIRLKSVVLPGPVRADQPQYLSLVHVEVDVGHCGQAAEMPGDSFTFKQVHVDLL